VEGQPLGDCSEPQSRLVYHLRYCYHSLRQPRPCELPAPRVRDVLLSERPRWTAWMESAEVADCMGDGLPRRGDSSHWLVARSHGEFQKSYVGNDLVAWEDGLEGCCDGTAHPGERGFLRWQSSLMDLAQSPIRGIVSLPMAAVPLWEVPLPLAEEVAVVVPRKAHHWRYWGMKARVGMAVAGIQRLATQDGCLSKVAAHLVD